jgi:hypothetical protein
MPPTTRSSDSSQLAKSLSRILHCLILPESSSPGPSRAHRQFPTDNPGRFSQLPAGFLAANFSISSKYR